MNVNMIDLTREDIELIVTLADEKLESFTKKDLIRLGKDCYYNCILQDFLERKRNAVASAERVVINHNEGEYSPF